MNTQNILLALQMVSAVFLVILILIQSKGTGLGRAFGSTSQTSFTRRGLERLLFRLTFIVCAVFISLSILSIVL